MSEPGGRRSRRASRSASARRRRAPRYGRFVWFSFLGSLVPGLGLMAAGKRRIGGFIFSLLVVGVLALAAFVVVTPTGRLASYGGDREVLLYVGLGTACLAVVWMLIALASHRSLEPPGLPAPKRFVGALAVVVAASVVVAPLTLASQVAFTQRDVISSISPGRDEESLTAPRDISKEDPWANYDRVNVLLLGGDIGKGRSEEEEGIRPDTQIVASVDTKTGDTTLISLPRNLGRVPFADDSPLYDVYPNGFMPPTGMPSPSDPNPTNDVSRDYLAWTLNAVWHHAPSFSGLDISGADANKWAVEAVLGLEIHWYMLVTLDGFERIINALGGITIDVAEPVPIHYDEPNASCVNRAEWIPEGTRDMDGETALMYARSRCNSDDYERMARQQQVLQAIIDEADPANLVTKYQGLAGAAKDIIRTDIDNDLFPALIELGVEVQGAGMTRLSIDDEFFAEHGGTYNNPDYDIIHAAVQEAIDPTTPDPATTDPATSGDELEATERGANG